MIFLLVLALSFGPAFVYAAIVYWLDRFEKEPWHLLGGAFIWGAVVATLGALIITSVLQVGVQFITGSAVVADITGTTILAPLVEESLKGIAVALILLIFPHEFDSILDGMVYGAIVALGFAATENVLYLYFSGYQEGGMGGLVTLFVLRVILGGWGHAVYTAFIGIGLAVARLNPNWGVKLMAPFLGWLVAVILHALHNGMATVLAGSLGGLAATLLVDWFGWAVALAVVIWAILRERRWMKHYLADEVERGTLSQVHYQTACSIRAQMRARWQGRAAQRFYEACAELAQKKHHLALLGNERNNAEQIERLRAELISLYPAMRSA
jgi:RsiW-degrading membrane proteinase PrsW (M82 family)